jgi:hypothetical protein
MWGDRRSGEGELREQGEDTGLHLSSAQLTIA